MLDWSIIFVLFCLRFLEYCNNLILNYSSSSGKENPWLVLAEEDKNEVMEPVFIELHATSVLCLPSGECMHPDATVCTTLMSALYSSVSEEVVLNRQLMVRSTFSSKQEGSAWNMLK